MAVLARSDLNRALRCSTIASLRPLRSSANRQAVDAQGGLPHAHRHALAFLAAGADAGVEAHVVADHADALERIRTVADERGAFHRIGELAVIDHVGLGGGEHELAAGDVHLPAAEVDSV